MSVCILVYSFVYNAILIWPFSVGLCAVRYRRKDQVNINYITNKEKQFDAARNRRNVIDGIPYTVMVFFRSDVKETGLGTIMQLAKREITNIPFSEE